MLVAFCCFTSRLFGQDSLITVLVLPPYDETATEGIAPDAQRILERSLMSKNKIKVIPFPLKNLMNVPYEMVYDKKYCAPIVEKVKCDIIIMTHLIRKNESKPGSLPWAYTTKIYNVKTGRQINSIKGSYLKTRDFPADIASKSDKLVMDIINLFQAN